MQLNNIKDLLLKSLKKTGKENQVISSIIYKSIINDFLQIKKIDITQYIISVKLKENIIFLRTQKPILNNDILNIEHILIQNIYTKLKNIGINIENLTIKFR